MQTGRLLLLVVRALGAWGNLERAMRVYAFRKLLGGSVRIGAWSLLGADIAPTARIGPGVSMRFPSHVTIGDGTALIGRILIDSWGDVRIGMNVLMNDDVRLLTAGHHLGSIDFAGDIRPIEIGDYAWLPVGVIVLPGVRIGRAVVVGTGSVVSSDVPDSMVVVANPARLIGRRPDVAFRYVPSGI